MNTDVTVDADERPRRTSRAAVGALIGGIVGLVGALALIATTPGGVPDDVPASRPLVAEATWPAGSRPAPDFRLRDQHGDVVSLASLRGDVVLLTFLDSTCEQLCAIEGPILWQIRRSLPPDERPVVAVVSVDPLDTPVTVLEATRSWGWGNKGWHWLMGTRADLEAVWRSFGIGVQQGRHDVRHTSATYVVDSAGYQRAAFASPLDVTRVVDVLRDIRADHQIA